MADYFKNKTSTHIENEENKQQFVNLSTDADLEG